VSASPIPHEELLRAIGAVADDEGIEAYAVGGAVRDAFLGRSTTDLDFVTVGQDTGLRLAEAVATRLGGKTVHVYETFGTAAIRLHGGQFGVEPDEHFVLEFVTARKESYDRESRRPEVEVATLEEDQARRDFTINALGLALNRERFGNLLDPFGGIIDLVGKRLRTPRDPRKTFDDDPLRMLRAARFAAQLGFDIDVEALRAMQERAPRIAIISQERITDELNKMLLSDRPSVAFKILHDARLIEQFLPELTALEGVETVEGQSHKDNFYHTLQVVDHAAEATADWDDDRALWLHWAALLHDIAKPQTKRFVRETGWTFHGHEDRGARMIPELFRRLKLPLDERMKHVQLLVQLHHRPVALVDDEVTDSAVRRLLFESGDAIEDLMTLVRADITSKNPQRVRRYLAAFDRVEAKFKEVEEKDRLRHFQPPVDGHEIMEALGVSEGIAVGIIKEWIREAILEGEIPNEHAAARHYLDLNRDEALWRAELFETMQQELQGPERAALGSVKDAVFWKELPEDRASALDELRGIAASALSTGQPEG
jgi:poly(A) polymerase